MNAKITSSRLDNEQSRFAFFDSQYKFAWCNGARNGAMVLSKRKLIKIYIYLCVSRFFRILSFT